jgi:P27 family predicted phage terminase small subunit
VTARKPAERRQGHQTADMGQLVPLHAAVEVPKAPARWLTSTRSEWTDLWGSPLAQAFDRTTDEPSLRRLFELRDTRERYARATRRNPLVEGSQGQPVANPLGRLLSGLDAEIRQLEDRFGMSALARFRLGISYGEARRSLAELAGMGEEEDDDEFSM